MRIDNIHFIESMFRPEYRHRMPVLIAAIVDNKEEETDAIVSEHVKDIADHHSVTLDVDMPSLKWTVTKLRKALRNRIKAFKVGNGVIVAPEEEIQDTYVDTDDDEVQDEY